MNKEFAMMQSRAQANKNVSVVHEQTSEDESRTYNKSVFSNG